MFNYNFKKIMKLCLTFLNGEVGVLSKYKHLGRYILGEILFDVVFQLNLGR